MYFADLHSWNCELHFSVTHLQKYEPIVIVWAAYTMIYQFTVNKLLLNVFKLLKLFLSPLGNSYTVFMQLLGNRFENNSVLIKNS